ncbi:YdcF family protein [Candidatus Saccharibacteria bacterium]|nr:MAG: YdcF family protein [Candidatus Saccharibacteria bacterium]
MRNSNTQLPTARELQEILAGESQRYAVRDDFIRAHLDIFEAYRQAASSIGVATDWIEGYANIPLTELSLIVLEATEKMRDAICRGAIARDVLDTLFDALVVQDTPEVSDAIFVFGSPADARIAHAVDLYHQDMAPRIIVSGKGPHYGKHDGSEAERMAQYARDHGVPSDSLMIEPASITLPDNVKRTLDMFEAQQYQPRTLCIIATTYISQRARMEWYKFTPWEMKIVNSPASTQAPELQRGRWYTSERGVRTLLNEYAKMVVEHRMDKERKEHAGLHVQ